MKAEEKKVVIAITEASYSGNKGAAAMIKSSVMQLRKRYGENLKVLLFSVWPEEDRALVPWDFVEIIPAKAEVTVFIAFPLALLYWMLRWCKPLKDFILRNPILRAYNNCDIVLDEAGVSFVDNRGFVMNTFAFICMAIPLLLGKTVVKYSQAMGSFTNLFNRIQAKIILPQLRLVIARGRITRKFLGQIGITKNVKMCADGAFSMDLDPTDVYNIDGICEEDSFYIERSVVGIAPSTVVRKKCEKIGIDYISIMADFAKKLIEEGYNILIFANSAREGTTKERNNDLPICNAVFEKCGNADHTRFYSREMSPDELVALVGKCRFVVTSRFHAMVFSLKQRVPVLLIGWSHKYEEVLDYFELGRYAIDFSKLSLNNLLGDFKRFVLDESIIKENIDDHYESVMKSSNQNIKYIADIIDEIIKEGLKSNR